MPPICNANAVIVGGAPPLTIADVAGSPIVGCPNGATVKVPGQVNVMADD